MTLDKNIETLDDLQFELNGTPDPSRSLVRVWRVSTT